MLLDFNCTPKIKTFGSGSAYDELGAKLRILFELLDGVVNLPPRALVEQIEDDYPKLKALLKYFNNDGLEPTAKFDLVDGPNPTLFVISGSKAKKALDAASDCNKFLESLCSTNPYSSAWPTPVTRSTTCTEREHAGKAILDALFDQLTGCESAHEILLSLSDTSQSTPQPTVDLLLSCCSYPNMWQETQCLQYREYVTIQERCLATLVVSC